MIVTFKNILSYIKYIMSTINISYNFFSKLSSYFSNSLKNIYNRLSSFGIIIQSLSPRLSPLFTKEIINSVSPKTRQKIIELNNIKISREFKLTEKLNSSYEKETYICNINKDDFEYINIKHLSVLNTINTDNNFESSYDDWDKLRLNTPSSKYIFETIEMVNIKK